MSLLRTLAIIHKADEAIMDFYNRINVPLLIMQHWIKGQKRNTMQRLPCVSDR